MCFWQIFGMTWESLTKWGGSEFHILEPLDAKLWWSGTWLGRAKLESCLIMIIMKLIVGWKEIIKKEGGSVLFNEANTNWAIRNLLIWYIFNTPSLWNRGNECALGPEQEIILTAFFCKRIICTSLVWWVLAQAILQ